MWLHYKTAANLIIVTQCNPLFMHNYRTIIHRSPTLYKQCPLCLQFHMRNNSCHYTNYIVAMVTQDHMT